MMEAKIENTDMFMVAGVQKVQLALDKSLAGRWKLICKHNRKEEEIIAENVLERFKRFL